MYRYIKIILLTLIFSNENTEKYVDIEGNEIIFKNQKWKYISTPDNECTIPFNVFINYILENTDIEFLNNQEVYRYGIYKMPHMNVCPSLDYEPYIYPINAEYQIKSNWDSLKVGMNQKEVREWLEFDPMISYQNNKIKYWEYYKFGTLEFDSRRKLLNWKYTGRDNQKVYKPKKNNINIIEKKTGKLEGYLLTIQNKVKTYYYLIKKKIFKK